jgi:hypothetical protein
MVNGGPGHWLHIQVVDVAPRYTTPPDPRSVEVKMPRNAACPISPKTARPLNRLSPGVSAFSSFFFATFLI